MRISILGCGWLGMPLARHLVERGYEVKGSVTSEKKKGGLIEANVTPYILFWDEKGFNGNLDSFLQTDVLIITVPPSKAAASGGLQKMISALLPSLEMAAVSKVIFISSISVYGSNGGAISEETPVLPETAGAKDIVAAETVLQSAQSIKATILRFGGLIGPDRHPVNTLSGKENLADPDAAINLIHLDDCIGIIEAVLEQEKWGHIINAVAPFHPSRQAYYTDKALSLGLEPPKFNSDAAGLGRVILSPKVGALLHYTFSVINTI